MDIFYDLATYISTAPKCFIIQSQFPIQNLSVPTLGGVVVHMRLLTGLAFLPESRIRLCESTCTLLQSAGTTGQWVVTGWPATVTVYNRCTESIKA